MINKDIFDALVTLLGDGKVEIPDIEQIRAISKVNKASKEERERNREINVIIAKVRGRASNGAFNLDSAVTMTYEENINAFTEAGYLVTQAHTPQGEIIPNQYFISWDENTVPMIPLVPADKVEEGEGDGEDTEVGDNEEGTV